MGTPGVRLPRITPNHTPCGHVLDAGGGSLEGHKQRGVRVLLIEDNPSDARLVREALKGLGGPPFVIVVADRLSAGLTALEKGGFDVALVDLSLPDSRGLQTFLDVRERARSVPVLVLSGLEDEQVAAQAVREGAQDYVYKSQLVGDHLARAILYALSRQQLLQQLEDSVAELKASEDRYHVVTEAAQDAIITVDESDRVVFANSAAERLFGLPMDEMLGKPATHLLPEDTRGAFEAALSAVSRTPAEGLPSEPIALVGRRKDGTRVPLELTLGVTSAGGQRHFTGVLRDMSQRRAAEEALQRSAARFGAIIEHGRDVTVLMGADRVWKYASPSITRVLGYDPKELVGRTGVGLIHPDDQASTALRIAEAMKDPGGSVAVEERLRHRDGSWRWVEATLTNRLDDPAVGALVANFHDISERKAGEALRRSLEARFSKVFRSSPLAICIVRASDGRFIDVNESYLRALGYERSEVVGHLVEELGVWADPGLRGATVAKLLERGTIPQFQAVFRKRSGEQREVLAAAELIDLEGDTCILGFFGDITDLNRAQREFRMSEEKYRQIVETAQEGIHVLDAGGRTTFANHRFAKMLGYTPEELAGVSLFDLLDNQSASVVRAGLETAEPGEGGTVELRMRRKDGSLIWVTAAGNNLFDEAGHRVGALAMVTDISERKAMAQVREDILDVVSHEFRTPVTVIQGYAELMGTGALKPDSPAWHAAREKIERSSKHLGFLLTSIVELSKLREGGRAANMRALKTVDLFTEAATAADARGPGPPRAVTLEVAPGAEMVQADRRMLLIVLVELLDNAAKYSPPDTPIVLRAWALDAQVIVEVEDLGPGIPENVRKDMFRPFVQADASSVRKTGGAGLGLAVVHGLVKAQEGRIEVESAAGKGSTVRVVLRRPGPA